MARRRQSPLEDIMDITAKLPWWAGVALAIAAYLILHSFSSGPVVATAPRDIAAAVTTPLIYLLSSIGQYVLPLVFLAGASLSVFGRWKRNRLHTAVANDRAGAALRDLTWQEFELLVGEAFRRQGYEVREQGGSAPDGGVDLVLRKHGKRYLVQCKHGKAWNVGVKVVRELFGVMAAENADGGFVVTSGVFSKEALAFATDKDIVLLDGEQMGSFLGGPRPGAQSDLHLTPRTRYENASRRRRASPAKRLAIKVLALVVLLGAFYALNQVAQRSLSPTANSRPVPARQPQAETRTPTQQSNPAARRRAVEAAFDAQYVLPKGCENWKSDGTMVECANHYIRAKRAFVEPVLSQR